MAIQIRRGTQAQFDGGYGNIVEGEPAIATDTGRFFVGTSNGHYAEFANATRVKDLEDNQLVDAGTINLGSGWSTNNIYENSVKLTAKHIVIITFAVNKTGGLTSGSWNTIGSIAAKYRPATYHIPFIVFNDAGNSYMLCRVNTNGNVEAYVHSEANAYLRGNVVYTVNDNA